MIMLHQKAPIVKTSSQSPARLALFRITRPPNIGGMQVSTLLTTRFRTTSKNWRGEFIHSAAVIEIMALEVKILVKIDSTSDM